MPLTPPLLLLHFAIATHDAPLAIALTRALGPVADRELRAMPRVLPWRTERPLLCAALDVLASA